jgi:hypothetical protein
MGGLGGSGSARDGAHKGRSEVKHAVRPLTAANNPGDVHKSNICLTGQSSWAVLYSTWGQKQASRDFSDGRNRKLNLSRSKGGPQGRWLSATASALRHGQNLLQRAFKRRMLVHLSGRAECRSRPFSSLLMTFPRLHGRIMIQRGRQRPTFRARLYIRRRS